MKKTVFLILFSAITFAASAQLIPVFSAGNSKAQNGINSALPIFFDKPELYETGCKYTPNLGRFTASVAGLYKFECAITLNGGTVNTPCSIGLMRNGTIVRRYTYTFDHSNPRSLSFATDLKLEANDNLMVVVLGTAGATVSENGFWSASRYSVR